MRVSTVLYVSLSGCLYTYMIVWDCGYVGVCGMIVCVCSVCEGMTVCMFMYDRRFQLCDS